MQAITEPLNQTVVERIQNWSRSGEAIEFRRLVDDLRSMEQLDALKELEQSEGDDGFLKAMHEKMAMAKHYEFVLHLLDCVALGHTPEKPEEKFPFITLSVSRANTAASVEKLLSDKSKPT